MLQKIKEILKDRLDVDSENITEETSFRDDLGIDSLDLFEMVLCLEDEYGIEVPTEELEKMKTVKDVTEYMKSVNIEV